MNIYHNNMKKILIFSLIVFSVGALAQGPIVISGGSVGGGTGGSGLTTGEVANQISDSMDAERPFNAMDTTFIYQQIATKQATLVSATNIRTINSTTLLGSGNISTTQTTITGNAGSATVLATPRTINGISFDGSANITVPSDIAAGSAGNLMRSTGTIWQSWTPTYITTAATSTLIHDSIDASIPTNISSNEIGFLNNLSSNAQSQINDKVATADSTAGIGHYASNYDMVTGLATKATPQQISDSLDLFTIGLDVVTGADSIVVFDDGKLAIQAGGVESTTIRTSTASDTLQLSDDGNIVLMSVGTANKLTVPLNSSVAFPVGSQITIAEIDTGQTTVIPVSGVVTINNAGGDLLKERYNRSTLTKLSTNSWLLSDNIENDFLSIPVAYWNLNENSGSILDQVNYFNGTVTGATYDIFGVLDSCLSFDGSDYIGFGNSVGNWGTNDFSVSFWIKFDSLQAGVNVIMGKWGGTETQYWYIYITTDAITMRYALNDVNHDKGIGSLSINTWYHIVYTMDRSGGIKGYLNGTNPSGTSTDISAHSAVETSNTSNFEIGRINIAGYYVDAKIDEVGLWNCVLTPLQISELYNAGIGRTYPW